MLNTYNESPVTFTYTALYLSAKSLMQGFDVE